MPRNGAADHWAWTVDLAQHKGQPQLSTQRLTLQALAQFAAEDWIAYPAISTLSDLTNLSKRALQEALKALVANGQLERADRPRDTTCYLLKGARGAPYNIVTTLGARGAPLKPSGFTRGWQARGEHEERKRKRPRASP